MKNRQEFKARTNPRDADTDNDGVPDGEENAGTVESFDGTTLTIDLFNGSMISGLVTDSTEIECEAPGDDNDQGDDDGSGDDNGSGGDDGMARGAMSSDDGSGDDGSGGDGNDDGNGAECTTADLTPGAVVQETELDLSNGQATFEEIDLVQ